MTTFKDSIGRTWELALTFGSVKRVQALTNCDLLNIDKSVNGGQPLMTILETDISRLVEVVIAILRPALAAADGGKGLNDEEFESSIDGDTLTAMHDAFWDELYAFFLSLRRTHLAQAVRKQRELVTAATAQMTERVDALDVTSIVGGIATGKPELSV